MITRRKDYAKRAPSRDSRKIYIICEGAETETDYFSFFEGLSSNLQLIIIPPGDGTDPLKLMKLAEQTLLGEDRKYTLDFLQQDKIWFAIDTDTWEMEDKIRPLREFCDDKNREISERFNEVKSYQAWNVAQSNPCFEIWLYYHHYDSAPDTDVVGTYPTVKAFVNDMIAGGFDFQRDPVRLRDAIANSLSNFNRQDNGNPDLYSTEQHLLGSEIISFVDSELQKLRNKIG